VSSGLPLDKCRRPAWLLVAMSAAVLAASCAKTAARTEPPDPARALARTLSILRGATAEHPQVLRILFYGQSISTRHWTDQAVEALRTAYPHVVFDTRNLAIGGFSAVKLQRTVIRDVQEFYPDLIIFHAYGDHRAYEKVIQAFRSLTAADIVVSTDHVTTPVEPLCNTGLHLAYSPPPGCKGHFWFKQNSWEEFMSQVWIPEMASRYGLAIEPRRPRWSAYLQEHDLKPASLLSDEVHPNPEGWRLMSDLFVSWFKQVVATQSGSPAAPEGQVQSFPSPAAGATKSYSFVGNRLEILGTGPLGRLITVRVDGKPPQEIDGCWQESRTSYLPNAPDWPAIERVTVAPDYHQADTWTMKVTDLNRQQDHFNFTLTSEHGGPDGDGTADKPFKSSSGRVSIDPVDWVLAYGAEHSGTGVSEGQVIQWHRSFVCGDQPPVALGNGKVEQRYVLATGLPNGPHNVEVEVGAGAPSMMGEVRAYRPSLKD
jgi:hypothetical protein